MSDDMTASGRIAAEPSTLGTERAAHKTHLGATVLCGPSDLRPRARSIAAASTAAPGTRSAGTQAHRPRRAILQNVIRPHPVEADLRATPTSPTKAATAAATPTNGAGVAARARGRSRGASIQSVTHAAIAIRSASAQLEGFAMTIPSMNMRAYSPVYASRPT